jgi:DNA-binding CsgD family transcriptional regulator
MDLSPRESEVLQSFAYGMSTDEVAEHLSISVHTVRAHLKNAMQALGAHSKLEVIIRAGQDGLIVMPTRLDKPAQFRGPPFEAQAGGGSGVLASPDTMMALLATLAGWSIAEQVPARTVYRRPCPEMTCGVRLILSTQGALALFHEVGEGHADELVAEVLPLNRPTVHVLDWLWKHLASLHAFTAATALCLILCTVPV